jgi:hypothetical protein
MDQSRKNASEHYCKDREEWGQRLVLGVGEHVLAGDNDAERAAQVSPNSCS